MDIVVHHDCFGLTTEVSDGDEPPLASDKHNKRERLIPVRSTDFVRPSLNSIVAKG